MLILRLQRLGKKKGAAYRLIVSEKKHDTQYGALENLGSFDPVAVPNIINLKADRIKYWLSVGAQMSDTVNNLLVAQGIISSEKRSVVSLTKKRQGKITAAKKKIEEEKLKAEEARKKAEEDKKKAEEEAKKQAETPKEEPATEEGEGKPLA